MDARFVPVISAGAFSLLFVMERVASLRRQSRSLQQLFCNGVLTAALLLSSWIFVRPAVKAAFSWIEMEQVGLLRWLTLPDWLNAVAGFALLDLSFYYWHRLNHRIPFLWRFHNVHHVDPELDTSTAFRFHFGEIALSSVFRFAQVTLVGPSLSAFLAYELSLQVGTFFHHSNLRLPLRAERYMNLVFVTPRMHAIHHSQKQKESDSNYSVVFQAWDRLHGTLTSIASASTVKIGVPAYPARHNRVGFLLVLPFRRQRRYWNKQITQARSRSNQANLK